MDDAIGDIKNVGGGIKNVPDGIYGLKIGKKIMSISKLNIMLEILKKMNQKYLI